jgi:NAD(P)-dependent dehydrogenase (short-subunit alcohol dehydrogenase family)
MGQLDGKTALVTGASTGIGLATARRFIAEGARVYVTGRREAELDAAAQALGPAAIPVRSDVSDLADLDRLFELIAADGAGLDVVFANAGGGDLTTLDELTVENYEQTFGINVRGTIFTVQKALPLLNPGASIVVTGSTSAHRGTVGFGVYSASKAALRQFVRVWAAEFAPRGFRVNTIVPGPTDTPALRGLAPDEASATALLQQLADSTTMARVADPDEIAAAVLFLASPQSSYVTGSELFADGGEVQTYS